MSKSQSRQKHCGTESDNQLTCAVESLESERSTAR